MKCATILFVLLWAGSLNSTGHAASGTPKRELIVCGREKVCILDLAARDAAGTPRIIWTWQAAGRPDLPKEEHSLFRSTDECKPVEGGRRILITSSTGGVVLVDRATLATVFHGRAVNAHSADLLPDGRIAVASSRDPKNNRGDSLILFDVKQSNVELWRGPLPSGHGVVWDDQRQLVWTVSDGEVSSYRLTNWNTPHPSLTRSGGYALPETGGHDLQPVPDTALLSVTTSTHCWVFDRDHKTVTPHPSLGDRASIKSISVNRVSGQTAFTQADRPEWWTTRIQFLNPAESVSVPGEQFYKVRWAVPASE